MKTSSSFTGRLIFICLLALPNLTGCVGTGLDNSPRTSLFGGSSRNQRNLPLPPAGAGLSNAIGTAPRGLGSVDQLPASGAIMPQLNNALTGNNLSTGLAQPMVTSPLLFQRLDRNTWRVAASAAQLFQTIARVLSHTYIIAQTDRHALSLSTDWDKFFIDGRLFRNRISINVFPHSPRSADLVIKNNIEYYAQSSQKIDENNPTQWLPTHDVTDELDRVLEKTQNQLMAQLSSSTTSSR